MKPDKEGADLKQLALMATVVTGAKAAENGDYLKLKTDSPVALFESIQQAGLLNKGDFSGVSVEKTQKYRKTEEEVVDSPGYWQEAGMYSTYSDDKHWEEAGWVGRSTHNITVDVPDGFNSTTQITSSKRADIRQEKNALFLAWETIDTEALKESYEKALAKKPVAEVLTSIVGSRKAQSLTEAFNAVKSIKPLTVEEANDNDAVQALQKTYAAAVAGVKQAVADSGLSDVLQKAQVRSLVKRGSGLNNIP
ncbi:MAG: hypothetical protein ACAH83_11805 [Alphaproteobacteria bacterium]